MSCNKPIDPECPCGKCPEPEIPITPPNPPECEGTDCVEIYDGACVKYTGPAMTCANITTGMTLNTIVENIATLICNCSNIPVTPIPFAATGDDTSAEACDNTSNKIILYSSNPVLIPCSRLYTDATLTTVFPGNLKWYKSGNDTYLIDDDGNVVEKQTCPYITFTVEDLVYLKSRMGIVNENDVAEWNIGFETYWGDDSDPTNAAFTAVTVTGNTITLFGGLDVLRILPLYQLKITAFDTTSGLPALSSIALDHNPNYLNFNTSVPITSTVLKHVYLNGNNFTVFNPTFALPAGILRLFLNDNKITTFDPDVALNPLTKIDLSNNLLTDFNPVKHSLPEGLEELVIDDNLLTAFNIVSLPSTLLILTLHNNLLTTFNTNHIKNVLVTLFLNNNALTEAAVNAVLTKYNTELFHAVLMLEGGTNACPTGTGVTAKDAILARGGTVYVNVCGCTRPTGLIASRLIASFMTSDPAICPNTTYDIKTTANVSDACAMWQSLKSCSCLQTPPNMNSSITYYMEYASLAIGQNTYMNVGTNCTPIPNGNYFLVPDTNAVTVTYLCSIATVTIVTIAAGVIVALTPCTYNCARPTGLHSARLLASFTTSNLSSCNAGVPTLYNIKGAADFNAACALYLQFNDCICPGNIQNTTYSDVQYATLAVGQKAYYGITTDCLVITDGIYFLWDATSGSAQGYFCGRTSISIVTISNGIITAIGTCNYTCTRPVGLHTAQALTSFSTNSNPNPCTPGIATPYNINGAADITAACAMFDRLKTCVCPNSPAIFTYSTIQYALPLALGSKLYTGIGTDCGLLTNGYHFLWDDPNTLSLNTYFCPLTTITVFKILNGIVTEISTTCNSLPPLPTDFITFTVSNLSNLYSVLGISTPTNPAQWNTAFNTYEGSATGAAFTAVDITGNTVKLMGGTSTLTKIPLHNVGLTAFNTSVGLSALVKLNLSGNPNYTTFNPSVALTSTVLDTVNIFSSGLTTFNPTFALPAGTKTLDLSGNHIVSFNPTQLLPNSLTSLSINNNSMSNFIPSVLPTSLQVLQLQNNGLSAFNANLLRSTMTSVNLSNNALAIEDVINTILAKCVSLNYGTGKTVFLDGGTNACPIGAGITAKNTLTTNGATVYVNSCATIYNFAPIDDNNTILYSRAYVLNNMPDPTGIGTYVSGTFTGYVSSGGTFETYRIMRINDNLLLNTTFNTSNAFTQNSPFPYISMIKIQPSNGKILAVGNFFSYGGDTAYDFVRIETDGTRDSTFNMIGEFNGAIRSFDFTEFGGGIVVVGHFTTLNNISQERIAKFSMDGTYEGSFANGLGQGFNAPATGVTFVDNNNIIVVGAFTTYKGVGTALNGIIKLNNSGSPVTLSAISGFDSIISSEKFITRIPNETSFYVAGYFTSYSGNSVGGIVKITDNGNIDGSFNSLGQAGFSGGYPTAIEIIWDNKIFVEGEFTHYNGFPAVGFIVLNANGTVLFAPTTPYFTPITVGDVLYAKKSGSGLEPILRKP